MLTGGHGESIVKSFEDLPEHNEVMIEG